MVKIVKHSYVRGAQVHSISERDLNIITTGGLKFTVKYEQKLCMKTNKKSKVRSRAEI